MDPRVSIIVIAVAVIVVLVLAFVLVRKQRTQNLRKRFGPEYDRTVREIGPHRAEVNLRDREKRVEKFRIRELSTSEREHFLTEWRVVQSRFIDDPQGSVNDADTQVTKVMEARGYPMSDFNQRATDLSVDHPRVVDNYRAAHEIALRHQQGQASTEDLRNALIYYRSLFDDLLQITSTSHKKEVA